MRTRRKRHGLVALLCMLFLGTLWMGITALAEPMHVVDDANLLSKSKKEALEEKLTGLSKNYEMDLVIVTTNEAISSAEAAADDFFNQNGYGVGADRSGALLYINMKTRDWWISTRGKSIAVFTDDGIQYIGKQIKEDLQDKNYASAFETYAKCCEEFILQAKTGEPYTKRNLPKGKLPLGKYLLISLVVGLAVAVTYTILLRMKLKSVAPSNSAADYMVKNSMHVRNGGEYFLYRHVDRRKKEKESSTHQSSSGATHGGGGGKF